MSEQMRKEFEEWFFNEVDGSAIAESLCWEAWQASRLALAVKLPEELRDSEGFNVYDCGEVKDALDAAGVRYE
jgi:hypothetical protein